jgi:hypothetical protein
MDLDDLVGLILEEGVPDQIILSDYGVWFDIREELCAQMKKNGDLPIPFARADEPRQHFLLLKVPVFYDH